MRTTLLLALAAFLFSAVAAEGRVRCKSSETGKYVSHAYAKKYPGLTHCSSK